MLTRRSPLTLFRTIAAIALGLAAIAGCSRAHRYQHTLDAYLAARESGDIDRARQYLSPDARIWFGEKTGPGRPKTLTGGWGAWDIEMNAVNTYDHVVINDDSIAATFHEQNDFSRLIGFPGWRARSTFWFDDQGRISEQLYQPLPQHPPQSACFEPPLQWAREHHPDELAAIYPNNEFQPSTDTARRWRALLIKWRRDANLPIPDSISAPD